MILFCSEQQITDSKSVELIAELTGDQAGAAVNSAAVDLAIAEISAELEACIRIKYPEQPFDDTQPLLNSLAKQGAYLILERDSRNGWSEDHREDYKLLQKKLEQISSGKIDLRTETEEQTEEILKGTYSSKPRLFGRNSLSGAEALV